MKERNAGRRVEAIIPDDGVAGLVWKATVLMETVALEYQKKRMKRH